MSYVSHNRLTFYALRRTISNFSYFPDCVSKVMFVSQISRLCSVVSSACRFVAYTSRHRFLLNTYVKRKIYRSYYPDFEGVFDFFHLRWSESTWPKPNHDLWHWGVLAASVSDESVTSLIDACLDITAQMQMINFIPCSSSKSYYVLIS